LRKNFQPPCLPAAIAMEFYIDEGFPRDGTFVINRSIKTQDALAEFHSISGVFLYAKLKRASRPEKSIWESGCSELHPNPPRSCGQIDFRLSFHSSSSRYTLFIVI